MLRRKEIKFGIRFSRFPGNLYEEDFHHILVPFLNFGLLRRTTTIDLTISDYHFEPETLTVPAGREITVNIENKGFVSHQFVVFKLGTHAGNKIGPEDEENIYWRFEVLPGHSDSATFVAPSEPGEYYITCGISGHLEAGMSGALLVLEQDS